MFIQTSPTPNPASLMFLPGQPVMVSPESLRNCFATSSLVLSGVSYMVAKASRSEMLYGSLMGASSLCIRQLQAYLLLLLHTCFLI